MWAGLNLTSHIGVYNQSSVYSIRDCKTSLCFREHLWRWMLEYSLTVRGTYSDISDAELDAEVAKVRKEFPGWGNHQLHGYLLSCGIQVQVQCVHNSQHWVDPEGPIICQLCNLQRRKCIYLIHLMIRLYSRIWLQMVLTETSTNFAICGTVNLELCTSLPLN